MAVSQRSPARVMPAVLERPQRAQLGGHRPFHIGGAAPVETVPLTAAGYAVADGDGVQVPVQHQAGTVACPRQPRVDVIAAVGHPALVDVEAEFAQLGRVVLADIRLPPWSRWGSPPSPAPAARSTRHRPRLSELPTTPDSVPFASSAFPLLRFMLPTAGLEASLLAPCSSDKDSFPVALTALMFCLAADSLRAIRR